MSAAAPFPVFINDMESESRLRVETDDSRKDNKKASQLVRWSDSAINSG